MNFGPTTTAITIAIRPAIRTRPMQRYLRRPFHGEVRQAIGDAFEPDRARGLHENRVTREHDLHAWSMRLWALRLELDGAVSHRRALARARWASARTS